MSAWRATADGIVVAVRAIPRSSREALEPGADCFAARLRAPPVDGAANTALVRLVATSFGMPRSRVTIIAGQTARIKRVAITGDATALAAIAARLYGASP